MYICRKARGLLEPLKPLKVGKGKCVCVSVYICTHRYNILLYIHSHIHQGDKETRFGEHGLGYSHESRASKTGLAASLGP